MRLFDMAFGCWRKRCSFPITLRGKLRRNTAVTSVTETYLVCLDCGHDFPYDRSQMKMFASKPRTGCGKAHHSRSRSLEAFTGPFAAPPPLRASPAIKISWAVSASPAP